MQSTELCPDHDTLDGWRDEREMRGGVGDGKKGPKEESYEERRIEGMRERLMNRRRTGRNEGTIERVWKK